MNWSVEQRRLLQGLGHDLMVHGRIWPTPAPAIASVPTPAPARASAAAPNRTSPFSREAEAPRAAAPAQTARLMEALRRAAGGADVAALAGDLDKLRREPALKRALWPRLRALRRSH
jgi:hypothetical protein